MEVHLHETREKAIQKAGWIGIITNILLSGIKALLGIFTSSIAVILDAVNNLSDAVSSAITILGVRFAHKKADREHPLGHGRMEYISALIVSSLVLYAGIASVVESYKGIIHPAETKYSRLSLILIGFTVIVKIILGKYAREKGKQTDSTALEASGIDAYLDAAISFSVLVTALFRFYTGIVLEPYAGLVIAVFIIRSGINLLIETINDILGHRVEPETAYQIRNIIENEANVYGAYDLILHNYGPGRIYGSVNIELPDTMNIEDADVLSRNLQEKVLRQTGAVLTAIGVYSYNTQDTEAAAIRNAVMKKVLSHEWAVQLHGFHVDTESLKMRFDVVLSFDYNPHECLKTLYQELADQFPDYIIHISADADIAD